MLKENSESECVTSPIINLTSILPQKKLKCVFSQKMKQAQAKVTRRIFVGDKLSKRLK